MDKEFVKSWVKALRSGDYKQEFGRLRSEWSYCCLGVACDLDDHVEWSDDGNAVVGLEVRRQSLPKVTFKKIKDEPKESGLRISVSTISKFKDRVKLQTGLSTDKKHHLIALNDKGASFELIADLIEEEFLRDEK